MRKLRSYELDSKARVGLGEAERSSSILVRDRLGQKHKVLSVQQVELSYLEKASQGAVLKSSAPRGGREETLSVATVPAYCAGWRPR